MDRFDVVVAGAGPAGALLALILARSGFQVLVRERAPDLERAFRGEGLLPSGRAALAQVGVTIDGLPRRHVRHARLSAGPIQGRARLPDDQTVWMVRQPALLALLLDLAARAGATVRFGSAVEAVAPRGQGLDVDGVNTRLLVGADGRGSTVRQAAGIRLERQDEPFDLLWVRIPEPTDDDDDAFTYVLGRPVAGLCYPSPDGGTQMGVLAPKEALRVVAPADRTAWLVAHAPRLLARRIRAAGALVGPSYYDVRVARAQRWGAPGILLIGDAAHPMSPVGGLGINMALRDALVAANHIRPALRRAGPIDVSAAVQREREPEIRWVQATQHRDGAWLTGAPVALRWLAPLALSSMPRLPAIGRRRLSHGTVAVTLDRSE